ncbi:diguanylate cyclase (GGDEF)-like protein/PAS domain S-box-containing protein [Bacillus ectoiniformans]|uniref:EAL domain-containing protein n=1 Tax=Bacillus ectoiniformans TaxID=1494429 RepID=UPI0019593164|nr:EAL domain-containing protein [Bacillus ectoiniformans]MBM7649872.1 diguanylate cyclase (GGDEF)-like protein/PAS domain S-box-containing protein [Bacillus ectoiniformans]
MSFESDKQKHESFKNNLPINELLDHDYQKLVRRFSDAIYVTAIDENKNIGNFVEVNEAACQMLEYSREELLTLTPLDIIDPSCASQMPDEAEDIFNHHSVTVESIHVTKSGIKIPVEVSSRILSLDPSRTVVLSIARDIRRRKEIEANLKKSRKQFDSLFQFNPDIIFSLDAKGAFIDLNPAGEKKLLFYKKDIIGVSYETLIDPKDLDKAKHHFNLVLQRHTQVLELAVLIKNNRLMELNITAVPIILDNEIIGIIGIARDITIQKDTQRRLLESKERFRSLFNHNPDCVFSLDLNGNFVRANPMCEKLLERLEEELVYSHYSKFAPPDELEKIEKYFQLAAQGESKSYTSYVEKNSKKIYLEVTNIPIYTNNQIVGVYCILKDISEKIKAKELLDGQNKILEMIARGTPLQTTLDQIVSLIENLSSGGLCSILLTDKEKTKLMYGSAPSLPREYNELIDGISIGPSVGSCGTAAFFKETVIVSDIETDPLWADYKEAAALYSLKSCWSFPILDHDQNVEGTFGMYYRERRSPDAHDFHIIAHATYLTNLAIQNNKKEELIHHQAYHDHLTDLPNRRLFQKYIDSALEQAKKQKKEVALLFLDLDRFKLINDSLGHNTGDLLLQKVSKRLVGCIEEQGTLFRQGGDEFIILLENTTEELTSVIAQQIIDLLSAPYDLDGHEVVVTPSIGISLFPSQARDANTLIKRADNAMYHAKRQGKNNFQFYRTEIDNLSDEKFETEMLLRKALEREEFVLHFQPQIETKKQVLCGAEALIRWKSSELGMISPAKFIPLAEESGLIVPIGEWVIRTACRQNKAWQDNGIPPFVISVNLSIRQFYQTDLVEKISAILTETGLDPKYLELEITESMTMHVETALVVLADLKKLGVKIAIDDFGTGYSSLNYLKKFPIDRLKIDQSFVKDISTDANDRDIVTTIIAMGHTLKKRVIAEGVETEEQLDFLKEHNCDEIQGYLHSPPVDAERFLEVIQPFI